MTIYGFLDKGVAERLARAGGWGVKPLDSNEPFAIVVARLSQSVAAYDFDTDTTLPSDDAAQLFYFEDGTGVRTTINDAGDSLPTVTVYNCLDKAWASGDHVIVGRVQNRLLILQGIDVDFKPLVRFTLAAALATSDASKTATVTNQYGSGVDQVTSAGGITVHNMLTSTASTYLFEGDSGDAGLAMWDTGTNYRIIQMECPA